MIRALALILLTLSALFTGPWLSIVLAVVYALTWFAPEIIVIGALLDAYFIAVTPWPYYTVTAFFLVLGAEFGKRHLWFKYK